MKVGYWQTILAQSGIDSQCQDNKRVLPANKIGQSLHDMALIFDCEGVSNYSLDDAIASKIWASSAGGGFFPDLTHKLNRNRELRLLRDRFKGSCYQTVAEQCCQKATTFASQAALAVCNSLTNIY